MTFYALMSVGRKKLFSMSKNVAANYYLFNIIECFHFDIALSPKLSIVSYIQGTQ